MEDVHQCTCVALTVLCFAPRVTQDDGSTALMWATSKSNESATTALLEHNANVDIKDVGTAGRCRVGIWGRMKDNFATSTCIEAQRLGAF